VQIYNFLGLQQRDLNHACIPVFLYLGEAIIGEGQL